MRILYESKLVQMCLLCLFYLLVKIKSVFLDFILFSNVMRTALLLYEDHDIREILKKYFGQISDHS